MTERLIAIKSNLQQSLEIVEHLIKDPNLLHMKKDLIQMRVNIQAAIKEIEANKNYPNKSQNFDKIIKIIDLFIKVLGVSKIF